MIYPRHHWLYRLFFKWYTKTIIRQTFKEFRIEGQLAGYEGKPLLVLANHFSWWDGFFHFHLNELVFRKRYHVMMLEEELIQRLFLTKVGVFGVRKGTKGALQSLQFAGQLLKDPQNMVLLFPQGKIESHHQHTFHFERGIERLLATAPDIQVVFVASFVDYFFDRKPIATHYLRSVSNLNTQGKPEEAFHAFFQECLEKQKELF